MRDTVKTLLSSIVDYAGLFPPAKLEMQAAMANYTQHQTGANCWMLGRFVLPVVRLDDFVNFISHFPSIQWSLSLIISTNIENEMQKVRDFKHDSVVIKSLEFPLLSFSDFDLISSHLLSSHLSTDTELFFEVPLNHDLISYLYTLQEMKNDVNVFAKIRTGGITADAFPTVDRLSQFITACAQINLPFKATAGLHHPLRSRHSVTYEPNSATASMHGFLNVAIVAALLYGKKITPEQVPLFLQEISVQALHFHDDRIIWQAENAAYELTLTEIKTARHHFFRSFGSCSFAEPVHDLKSLNLI